MTIDIGVTDGHFLNRVGGGLHVTGEVFKNSRRSLMRTGWSVLAPSDGTSNVERHPTLHGSRHRPYGYVLCLSPQMRPSSLRNAP